MRYLKNWFTEFENIISTISINITSHFPWKNFTIVIIFILDSTCHQMKTPVEIVVVQGLTNRSKKWRGKNRHDRARDSKANPIPTERFEAIRESKSRDFRTRLEFKRGLARGAYLVVPRCFLRQSRISLCCFCLVLWGNPRVSLLLGKSFFSKIKLRNALPFVPEFSSRRFVRGIDCRPWNIKLAEKLSSWSVLFIQSESNRTEELVFCDETNNQFLQYLFLYFSSVYFYLLHFRWILIKFLFI